MSSISPSVRAAGMPGRRFIGGEFTLMLSRYLAGTSSNVFAPAYHFPGSVERVL